LNSFECFIFLNVVFLKERERQGLITQEMVVRLIKSCCSFGHLIKTFLGHLSVDKNFLKPFKDFSSSDQVEYLHKGQLVESHLNFFKFSIN